MYIWKITCKIPNSVRGSYDVLNEVIVAAKNRTAAYNLIARGVPSEGYYWQADNDSVAMDSLTFVAVGHSFRSVGTRAHVISYQYHAS